MKNHHQTGPCRDIALFRSAYTGIAIIVVLLSLSFCSTARAAHSFVVGFQGVDVIDTAVDTLGTTFIVGRDATNNCVIRKYDASGAVQPWINDGQVYRTITNLNPRALCIASGVVSTNQGTSTTNQIYVVGLDSSLRFRIVRLNIDTGAITADLTDSTVVEPKSVKFSNGALYVCGNYSRSVSTVIFGKTANPRGTQASILMKLDPNLPSSNAAINLTTFGGSLGGNTAESLAVDETGDAYVAGSVADGVFTLDGTVAANGFWKVDVVYSSSGIGDLNTADNVLAGANATRTNTAYFSTINFGSGAGDFGGDAAFPGGGGDHFVTHATGTIWIGTAGSYTFRSRTDDGTRVKVDGTSVITVTGLRGDAPSDADVTLGVGLHTIDYVQFENEGAESAELSIKPTSGSTFSLLVPTKIRDIRNKGYVAKFSGDFSVLKEAYSSASEGRGSGGAYHELHYADGWVYAVGYWKDVANNPTLGLPDVSVNASLDIDIVKLDTALVLKGRATVKGAADNEGISITADEAGNAYFTGSYGAGSSDFIGNGDRSSVSSAQDRKFTSRSAPVRALFIAKLDSNMDYKWVNQPINSLPDSFSQVTKARWNPSLQRVFWTGSFVAPTNSLTLGQPANPVTLNGSQGFMAVIDPDGTFSEQVLLVIVSDYGKSGTQILPYGGPLLGTNITTTNSQYLIKGVQMTASVPPAIFRRAGVDVDSDIAADTRIRSTGYSVDNNVPTGGASSYTFVLSKDTTVKWNWDVDYALNLEADLSETVGTGDPLHNIPGIQGLTSEASGNPVPAIQKHWIGQNETVIATIDSETMDLNNPGLPVKYVVTGYDAAGPPNTQNSAATNRFPFTGNEIRRQVPQFIMTTNALIRYHWKLKIGVRVDTTGPASVGFPYLQVIKDGGSTNIIPIQSNGVGVGTFYFDEHTSIKIGTLLSKGNVGLKGWLNGDGFIFDSNGTLAQLTTNLFSIGSTSYVGRAVQDLVRPARVMWDYGDKIFEETVFIGNYVTFSTVDSNIFPTLRRNIPPPRTDVVDGPQNSSGQDMDIWDAAGKVYYPLRPGTVLSYWQTTSSDTNSRIIIRLVQKYPIAPHYRHIANTPPVRLDPATNDPISFNSLKYTEATTGAQIDNNGAFTATGPGKTVLLFNQSSDPGHGGVITTLRVRVAESKLWDAQLPAIQTALIGQKITSAYDTAGLGTGFTMFTNARYDPFIYDSQSVKGPIIPVNLNPSAQQSEQLVVVWYETRDKILWPYQAVRYEPAWPTPETGLNRIVIASRFGSESVAFEGTNQIVTPETVIGTNIVPTEITFNPARFQQVQIYNQPVRSIAGYNPNEEHALMAPSLRSAAVSPRPMAAYALRDGDLNVTNRDATYTSDPYVLVQFFDTLDSEFKMKVYSIVRAATNANAGDLSYTNSFDQDIVAGEPVVPFYPLPQVIGATPCSASYGKDGKPAQRCFWRDHKDTAWAVSGDSFFTMYFYYPLSPDFFWPNSQKQAGDCVAWLPATPGYAGTNFVDATGAAIDYRKNDQSPAAQGVIYNSVWPQNVPILKVGETLTFPGGEYHSDHPTTAVTKEDGSIEIKDTPGLPGVVGWASGEIVFDTLNPNLDKNRVLSNYTARLYPGLEQRTVSLPLLNFPSTLLPASKRTRVKNGNYSFVELSASLQKRISYDPINGQLVLKGFLNDKDIGDPTLTASPPAVYVLEPNILTSSERDALLSLQPDDGNWTTAVQKLYVLSRNPSGIDLNGDGSPDEAYDVGVSPELATDQNLHVVRTVQVIILGSIQAVLSAFNLPTDAVTQLRNDILVLLNKPVPQSALGPGLAVTANPAFLDPTDTNTISYVTMAENNDQSLGSSPVVLHIIKVDKTQRYRGAIKTVLSDNVFDENIILRHTGDFGGNAEDLVFEWWYRPEDGTEANTPDRSAPPNPWKLFADPSGNQGKGFYQLTLKGNPSAPEALIGDSLFFLRYRHKKEVTDGVNWEIPQVNGEQRCVLNDCKPGIPYDWAGAGNSSPQDIDQDGQPDYKPQLAEGWIKRVIDRVNVYEARINDFTADNPATYSSMIRELGARFEGPVALNPDKNVIENVGLIALYQTILDRGMSLSIDLSTPISTPSIANALELASTRLSDFYQLLGNEAYADALNPTIGFGSSSVDYGTLAPTVFCFQNQMSSLLEEELALLRGQDAFFGAPVYNRLFWNFTHAEGEAAYAMNYDIKDVNKDGFIDVDDAMILYPMGHGDAWGHYLTAVTQQYDLLRHPFFNWVSRSEFLNLQDIVVPVDYLDERKFAQAAAAKAKAGTEIVNMTYRQKYVADPGGQWQGYLDTDKNRSWGVEEWARRAGQGAYFDWVTANALIPAVHPNTNYTGIQKIDRTTVLDINVISANLNAVQTTLDQVDNGNNPLGLAKSALTFDIDPTFLEVGSTAQIGTRAVQGLLHFDQIFERALAALKNAVSAFDNANELNNMVRHIADTTDEFQDSVFQEDLGYRNQLIEIFGTPYQGTIGTGKAYPPGYAGPDTMLYMYVGVNTINDSTAPKPPLAYISGYMNEIASSDAVFTNAPNGDIPGLKNDWVTRYGLTFQSPDSIVQSVNYSDFSDPTNNPVNSFLDSQMQESLHLPILAKGYTFVAPAEWGLRSSPGELQQIISQMVQAQVDLNDAIYKWSVDSGQYLIDLQKLNAKYTFNKNIVQLTQGKISFDSLLQALSFGLKLGAALTDIGNKAADIPELAAKEGVPKELPIAGFAFGLGDALSAIRAGLVAIEGGVNAAFDGVKVGLEQGAEAANLAKDIGDAIFELKMAGEEKNFDLIQNLQDVNFNSSNESAARMDVFKAVQHMVELSDQYRAKLAEGNRLLEQRAAFNKRVAGQAQQNRYQDMTFRVARNAALEKYRSAFDLAARYTYLAATAYDYDINLAWNDAGSPADIFADIIKQRSLGYLVDGQPAIGKGGLSEDLAVLKANYDNLKTRMGLNNYVREGTTFSLRKEAFRISSDSSGDDAWKALLRSANVYKQDLWQLPEFRRYCRPFTSQTNGPQPGLVIPFSTQIKSGKNYFGWPLGGGDNSYDPSIYATKIDSVGVWFANYDVDNLPQTPRVYWIPVGDDIMTIPNDPDLNVRVWNVLDTVIPVPFASITSHLDQPAWRPLTDSLDSPMGVSKRFSSMLAFGFQSDELSTDESDGLVYTARLVGRSAWNTKWELIIPGATLNANPTNGLNLFIDSVSDIKLVINSYGFSGN